ncbi:hypothetical protein ACKKBG_A24990 [Auxenochlorella protothecoides x Auxenochlorella symbiontica]
MRALCAALLVMGMWDLAEPTKCGADLPLVANTWAFTAATESAWEAMTAEDAKHPAMDAIEMGATQCEDDQCDGTVGYGGSPDEAGETTLDAMIMDGDTMDMGAVGDLRHVKHALSAARMVLRTTRHSLLTGLQATQFAMDMGMKLDDLSTKASAAQHAAWRADRCQPNFRRDVCPDPARSCGPYSLPRGKVRPMAPGATSGTDQCVDVEELVPPSPPAAATAASASLTAAAQAATASHGRPPNRTATPFPSPTAHDTIALLAIDRRGSIAAGASTNGAAHKVPGRVGDAAVAGGGAYADSAVGACGATGDGDVHLRFLPCYQVVESMRAGAGPAAAAEEAMRRIADRVPGYVGAVLAADRCGALGAAAVGWNFTYAYRHARSDGVRVVHIAPLQPRVGPAPAPTLVGAL